MIEIRGLFQTYPGPQGPVEALRGGDAIYNAAALRALLIFSASKPEDLFHPAAAPAYLIPDLPKK